MPAKAPTRSKYATRAEDKVFVSDDVNGYDGVHQTSVVTPSARSPTASTVAG